jgi:hypothetical protein
VAVVVAVGLPIELDKVEATVDVGEVVELDEP